MIFIILITLLWGGCSSKNPLNTSRKHFDKNIQSKQNRELPRDRKPSLVVAKITFNHDEDNDGLNDLEDILEGARNEAKNKPRYRSAYYSGGYPPETEGVCTDTIWRAFKAAGYDLKELVDVDIRKNTALYPRVNGRPDPNIDFRRVPNLISFFKRHSQILTTQIVPGDVENLRQWQGGDIVVYGKPLDHIAIVSNIRRDDGVPFTLG